MSPVDVNNFKILRVDVQQLQQSKPLIVLQNYCQKHKNNIEQSRAYIFHTSVQCTTPKILHKACRIAYPTLQLHGQLHFCLAYQGLVSNPRLSNLLGSGKRDRSDWRRDTWAFSVASWFRPGEGGLKRLLAKADDQTNPGCTSSSSVVSKGVSKKYCSNILRCPSCDCGWSRVCAHPARIASSMQCMPAAVWAPNHEV